MIVKIGSSKLLRKSVGHSTRKPSKKNLQQTALPKKPQTLVAQRIEDRKNLQHFCNKKPRNYPEIPQNTASREALFFQKKAKKKPRNHCDSKVFSCLLLPKKIQPGKPCGSMDSGFCATCVFVFLRFFQAISEPPYDILTKPCANRGEKRAVRQHSPLSYFSLMICSYSMAYLFSITILL